ncbi:hypothetical protein SAY87_006662 [Trapa incisa]|uniref:Uncharacterized protein n=1 Tax=Trapa incisa TaxID=236973 RepID=A0AAN7K2S0_9MYRT|nr:hypothetical protein SAY87_006662 [Trapa incisa]
MAIPGTTNWCEAPWDWGYYEGESSRSLVILDTDDHGRARLLKSVGCFRSGGDVVRAKNWLHDLRKGMDAFQMHYLDSTLVATSVTPLPEFLD